MKIVTTFLLVALSLRLVAAAPAQVLQAASATNAPKAAGAAAATPSASNAAPASAQSPAQPSPPAPAAASGTNVAAPAPARAVPAPAAPPAAVTNGAPSPTPGVVRATKPPATNAPVRNIRFQFDGIPYMDVIERFSQMVNKPLVTDTNVQGTLTFNDPQPYTYEEALDVLNLMLSMKGMMLVESGHYLQLVPFRQLPQMPLKILRGTDHSGDVRPGEIVTVVLPVKNVDSKEIADAITAMLSNAGSLAPLSKGRGLIITDKLANIQRIRYLLSQIDTEASVDRQMKTYTLLHASGAIVADLLNRTFGVATAPKRTQYNPNTKSIEVLPPDPNDYITAVYDDASRTLVLFGPTERLALAEELVSRFEQKEGGAGDVRIYYPQSIKPDELAALIRQAIPGVAAAGETAASAATKARVIPDNPQNRLIVAAPIPGQLDEIELLITRLDRGVQGGRAVTNVPVRSTTVQLTKVFRPRAAEATNVAQILTAALTRKLPSGQLTTTASVSVEPLSQSVVVSGSPGDVQIASDIVSQLETGTTQPTPLQTRFIDVGTAAEAQRLLPMLEQIYKNQVSDGAAGQVAHAKILADADSGRLIVTASEEHLAKIEALVQQLRGERGPPRERRLQILPLKNNRVESLLKSITELVTERMGEKRFRDLPKPLLLSDPANNRLLITASDDQFREIEQIVTTLDVPPTKAPRETRVLGLKTLRVDAALPSLNNLLNERLADKRFEGLPKPLLVPDAPNNRLLVTATDEQFREIESVLQLLDVPPEKITRQMTLVPVHSKPASELIALAQQLITQLGDEQPNPALAPRLIADASGKQIIVLATQNDAERIQALIQQLDSAAATAVARQFKSVELFSRQAAEFTPLVQQLYTEQLRGLPEPAGGPATLIADPKNNRIMVSAAETEIARVESLIRQLDPSTAKPAQEETRVLRLKTGIAQDLAGLVEKSLGSQATKVKVLVDARSNSLVVSGEAAAVEAAARIIGELDTRSDLSPREVRILELKQGDAASTASLVNSLFADLMRDQRGPDYVIQSKIVPDAAANRLIVTGPREELKVLATVVEQLDQAPEAAGGARVFKLLNADAMQVVGVVSNAMLKFDARNQPIRRVSISAERESNSIIVAGPRNDLKDAEAIIQRLDNEGLEPGTGAPPGAGRTRELKIIEVKSEDPDALATLATRVFAAQHAGRTVTNQVTITVEPNSRRLIVLAPAAVLPQVETVIATLDSKPDGSARELVSIEVKNQPVAEILPTVQRIYAEQTQGKTTKPATIYPDANGRRFMVYGTREQAEQVRQIVATLETQPPVPRETKTFDLGRLAEAQRVLPLAQQLYRDQIASQPNAGPPDAQMVSDGRTGRLIVSARTNQMPLIESLLARLQVGALTNQPARETRAFDVGTAAEVQRLVPLVEQLYKDQWKDRPETDPADAQIIGDPRGGRLVVTGKPDHVKAIETILKQFVPANPGRASPTGHTRDTRVFDLSTANALELATTVRTLYLDEAKARLGTLTPDTLIVPDAGANRLIVVGETEELDAIEAIIKKLDKASAQSASARIFKLKAADPAKVAEILSTALVRYDAYGRPQKRCSVSVEAKSRMLIVTGDPKELQGVSTIIEQLDQSLGERPERKMKVLTLKQGRVADLLAKARQLYNDQLASQPELGTTDLLMMEDTASNQIILAGTDAQLAAIERIVGELQRAAVATGPRETKMIEIGFVDEMTRLLPLVQQMYQERVRNLDASDTPDAQIISDTKNARFIVTARSNHIAIIESLVKELRALDLAQPRDTRLYDLTTVNATEFASTVRSLYLDQSRSRPGAQPQDTTILPDVSANRLIVTGASNELAVVEEIIKKLDKVTGQSGTVRLFKLKSADPQKVMEILGNALTSYDAYGRQRRRVGITLDAKTRTIIVAGDPKELQALQNAAVIIEQLDTALGQQAERQIKVLTLKQARVADLSPKVRQLYNDQLASQPELGTTDVLILDDPPGNQLILAGSQAQLALIEKIVADLEAATLRLGERVTRMIDIGQVDELNRLLPLVQQIYQEHWKNKAASDPADAAIMPDTKNARLIVTARTNHIAEIEAIVKELRAGQPLVARDTRILDLTTANAVELVATVKALYQDQLKSRPSPPPAEAAIVADAVANRLVLSGPTNELDVVEDLVRKLDKVGAQSASVRVFKLKQAEPEKVLEILQTAMVRYDAYGRPQKRVAVSVDAKSRTLILTGDPKELQGASVILEQLDSIGAPPERRMKVLPVKAGRAADMLTKVRAVYTDQIKAQPELGTTEVLMLEDETSNQIILAGTEPQLKLIEQIAAQLETSAIVQEPRETRVYELTSTAAPELATTVKSLYQEAIKTRPTSPASQALILPDVNANRLIVSALTNDLQLIDDIIQKIDKAEAQSGRTRVFRLKQAEAEQVARILSTALVQLTPYGRQVPRVSVGTDPANNLLIVSGAPQDLQGAALIIEQMDQMLAGEPRQLRVLALTNGLASEVATRVKSLYQDQLKGRPKTGGADAIILGDDQANRLVVTATESHMKLIEEIVGKLQETGRGAARQTRVLPLQRNSATSVAAMLSQLFAREIASQDPNERLALSASADDRAVVLDGAGDTLKKAEELVKNLDGEGAKGAAEVRTYQVPDGKADELAQSLARLFAERTAAAAPARPGQPAPVGLGPRFEADPKANVLMVAATREQFEQITKLLDELKKSAALASEIRTFLLKHGDAEQVANVLEDMLSDEGGSQPRPPGAGPRRARWRPGVGLVPAGETRAVHVAPAAALNAVVVQGPPDKLALAEKIILSLDAADAEGQSVIQTVHLKKAHATDLADAVSRNIAARGAQSRLQRVSVTAVEGPNNLLISGPADAVQEVMKLVRELDTESEDDEIEVRIYKLENGTAKEVSAVVNQLLQSVTRAQARMRPGRKLVMLQPTVSVDERSNSLIVSATPSHFKVIEKMLAQLDQAASKSDRDVHFAWLKNGKADEVALKIKAVFEGRPEAERPVVDADTFANSLTVIARRSDLPQIQELIARLDESTKDTSIQVRLRTLDTLPADQMARMLRNLYPQMSRGTIRIVDKLPPPPDADARSAPATKPQPTNAPPPAAAPAPAPPPEVVVAVDKDANALLLSGPANELDRVERIITELSFAAMGTEAEMRLFSLKEADPVIVARTLNDLFKQEQVRVEQPGRALQPGEVRTVIPPPKVTAVAEPRTRSVIVRAKATDFTLIESLIQQLDVSGLSAEIGWRLVPLTNAQPQKVLPLVQQMVAQLNLVRPGEPLTVTLDARARALLVIARDTLLGQIEKMIRALDTPTEYAEAQVLVVSLKKASAVSLATLLNNILKPAEQNVVTPEARELQEQVRKLNIQNDAGKPIQLDLTKPIKVLSDPMVAGAPGGNRLIVSSTADNLKALGALIALMDTVPVLEGVDVKLVPLVHADASTVAQTINSIFAQGQRLALGPTGPGQPEGAAGKALAHPLNVAVDTRANTLILSGQKESIELAVRVIEDLDQQIERFVTEVRLYRLKHASATRLLPLLQAVFAEGPPVPGSEGLSTLVTRLRTRAEGEKPKTTEAPKARPALVIQADDLSNTLIVAARSDALPLIEDVINQLDIPAASGLETVRIYPLDHGDATAVRRILTELYSGPKAAQMRTEDKPSILVDERSNSLIVSGNGKSFAIIEGLLQKLDQKLPFELRDVHIIPLEHTDATGVAGTLQRLMDARVTQRAATSSKEVADALKVTILADDRSNSLLVAGGKDAFELVQELAQQLDAAEPALSGRIRLVPLQYADARVLATSLTTLFTQRYAAARTPEMQRKRPIILADARSNSLLVAASPDDNQALDDLLKRLDQKLDDPSMTVSVWPLRHNDAARVATTLDGIFTARTRARTPPGQQPSPQDTVRIETDALNNALVVYANKENQDLLKGLLEKIDVEPVEIGGVIEAFTLEFADASRVATMLRTLVQQGLYRPGAPAAAAGPKTATNRDALAVTVDPRSNTLIVSASPENLLVVREIIRKVDTKDFAATGNVKVYPLKKARASSLATVLEQFFRAKRAGEAIAVNAPERTVPMAVIPDDRSNVLLVTGSKEGFDVMDRLVQQLDGEDVFARMNFRVFPLKRATATKLQSTLRQIVTNRLPRVKGEPLEPINIVADSWVNALLVGASVEDLTLVASLIEQLDSDQADLGVGVQVLPLAKADSRRVAQTIQALFRDGAPGTALPVMVTADERINGLVVSAGEADLKRISELVKKLDTDQVSRVSEIRIFPLRYARADSLATILNTALNTKPTPLNEMSPNTQSLLQFITRTEEGKELVTSALKEAVLITPDARMNSLIVSGPVDYMSLLEQLITRLDTSSPQQARIKVFTLQNADAQQMAQLLVQLFRMQQAAGGATGQRSIQYTLMRPNLDPEVIMDEDEELASATLGTAEQAALTVTVDPRTNSLLVGGTDHYVDLVSKIIEALDSSPAQERKTELYRLRNAQAQEVATAIRSFLDQERQRVTQVLGAEAVGTAQRLLDREVAIVAENVSNTLLVSANPRYFDEIKALIEELDQPQPQVLIQVLLAEVTLDAVNDLGVEWKTSGSLENHELSTGTDFGLKKTLTDFGGFSTAITGDSINFLLRALQNDGRLEVLSRPQILTSDNKPATINVGQRVPVITDSRISGISETTINSYRYEELGVTLTVTPRIAPDGFVKMDVGTTNSTLSSSKVQVGKDLSLPVFNQRRANTTVSVQSGQTVIIGGLIGTVDDIRTKRVPVLGSIPYLGALFRSQTKSQERRELLIFLTPQVVVNVREPGQATDLKTALERETKNSTIKTEIKRDPLQRQLLDPIFPESATNAVNGSKPEKSKKSKSTRPLL